MVIYRSRKINTREEVKSVEYNKENLTTIAVFLYMIISPVLNSVGCGVDQVTFTNFITALVGLAIALVSAKHPNTLESLGNDNTPSNSDETC